MAISLSRFLAVTSALAVFLTACATPLPPTYDMAGSGRVLEGAVLALEGDGDTVAAATEEGLFLKRGDGPWSPIEAPGIRKWNRISSLAVREGVVYMGSDGEGLHIYSAGTWEVRTSRYGGLPDDGVLSIAVDRKDNGLEGEAVWVGTRDGIAALRGGQWEVFTPGDRWLMAMSGNSPAGAGKVYVSPGYKLGRKGEDSDRFRPPVSAIAVGEDRIVLGNRDSRLAFVTEEAVSVIHFRDELKFTDLQVGGGVVWAGTEAGLLWGGLRGHAEGKPWPVYSAYLGWTGTFFGSRDTRDFEYRWKNVGYNTAVVAGLEKRGADLWTAYRSGGENEQSLKWYRDKGTEEYRGDPITDVRRYENVDEYIARKQKVRHESYGLSADIKGKPSALYVSPDADRVYIGTTSGLWELAR